MEEKKIIGNAEWLALTGLGIPAIRARVDSGARKSALHAFNIQRFRRDGEQWVSFEVHPLENNRRTVIRCEQPVFERRSVKSSSGLSEDRYIIRTPVEFDGKS